MSTKCPLSTTRATFIIRAVSLSELFYVAVWACNESKTFTCAAVGLLGLGVLLYALMLSKRNCLDWLIDWLMITYIALFSALLSRLTALAYGSTCVTSFFFFNSAFFEYPPKWCTYSAGMAGATWNCSRLGASSVYTIQPCTMSLHAKPHT